MTLTVVLNRNDQSGFEAFLADLYDPTSPSFRQFLSPQEPWGNKSVQQSFRHRAHAPTEAGACHGDRVWLGSSTSSTPSSFLKVSGS